MNCYMFVKSYVKSLRVLLVCLILILCLAQPSYSQQTFIQNEAQAELGSPALGPSAASVDSKGNLYTSVIGPSGETQSVIPVSNATDLNGVGVGVTGGSLVAADLVEAASTTTVLNLTSHAARVGDWIVAATGTAANIQAWSPVCATTVNTVTLCNALPATPAASDQVNIHRPVPIASSGVTTSTNGAALATWIDSGYQRQASTGILKLEDAATASGDAGVAVFGVMKDTLTQSAAANDYYHLTVDMLGRTVTTLAPTSETWQACSSSNTGTSDVAIKAAVASNRIYVHSISCFNTATVASSISFKSDTSTIYGGAISNSTLQGVAGYTQTFPVPLRTGIGAAFNFAMGTTATATTCCANGFTAVY